LAEDQSQKFSIKVVNKTAVIATHFAVHFASCLFTYNFSSKLRENKQKFYIAYLSSWH